MTQFEWIGQNLDVIKTGIKCGRISTTTLSYFRIYTQIHNYRALGYSITESVFQVAEDNKLGEDTIYRIKREMETDL